VSNTPEQSAPESAVFQANAITIELPRQWFDIPRNIQGETLAKTPYAHGIYDAVGEIEGVKAIYAVADGGYVPHQGLNIVALDDDANAAVVKAAVERAVETVTRPTYGYSKSAISTYEAAKARVSTAVVQSSHGEFPFNGEPAPFAATYLNNLRDGENPMGDTSRLIQAFDGGLGNMPGNMAVIHQFVQSGVDAETEEPVGHTIIRGLIQMHGDMDEVKSRFHAATREALGGLGYGEPERHTVLPVERWPGQELNA